MRKLAHIMDKRRATSHQAILQALAQFAVEGHPFATLTVADLAKQAHISRPTIYRNYLTLKEPLLLELRIKMTAFTDSLQNEPINSTSFFKSILFYWQQNLDLFELLMWADLTNDLNHIFARWIVTILDKRSLSKQTKTYIANFYAATTVSFIHTFIDIHDFSDASIDQAVRLLNKLTNDCGQLFYQE
ncbi:TetR/AcrR family transcriptional regulator [Loigolactobacillus backii]|nr:TetR/AcrR family transcriptional regulator [Loigolactobacillus backii]ANK67650.1 hypothetical protein AYR55_08130 [Loigolactobacillus backii]ANK70640.1 hypothetical protein AYR56_11120 [Loigolactobacillus backii]MDA5387951.1 TetR/AcrR family transcriptional regulator [Loigolactobacillus backii]MDA5390412.1 TetR/AcrR family transcriptional regulator [Loigolactobacillus backii]